MPEVGKSEPVRGEDPFSPERADDPVGVLDPVGTEARDPSDPITREPGIVLPALPPPPPPPSTPPPGHADLVAARARIPTFADSDGTIALVVTRAEKLAEASRDSFADLWMTASNAAVAQATSIAGSDQGPLGKLRAFTGALAASKLQPALAEWRAARDAVPTDLTRIANAANDVTDQAQDLLRGLAGRQLLGGMDVSIQSVVEVVKGIVRAVGGEADLLVAGARVPAAGVGDAICLRLERPTADANWRQRLENTTSWDSAGDALQRALNGALKANTLDQSVRTERLKALDSALNARQKPRAGDDPYHLNVDVRTAYVGVVQALHDDIESVKTRLKNLAAGTGKKGDTTPALQKALDLLYGTMRVVRDGLAGDPIAVDPDLSPAVRTALSASADDVGPTTQETSVAAARRNFRAFWRKTRDRELKALKALGAANETLAGAVKNLGNAFDSDLGPLLDKWSGEFAKGAGAANLHDLTIQIEGALTKYRIAVLAPGVGDDRGSGLLAGLDALSAGLALAIRSSPYRERLFR